MRLNGSSALARKVRRVTNSAICRRTLSFDQSLSRRDVACGSIAHTSIPCRGLMNLTSTMNLWTRIETKIDNHLFLSSPRLLQMPFVYVTTADAFELSETEKKNVKKFFDNGGFMVLETATPQIENNQARASLKEMIRETLDHARFEPIPMDHHLFHCFFDFEGKPPQGAEIGSSRSSINKTIHYLEGVWYKGRLAAVYSDKGYIVKWTDLTNNFPQLKMGINMIVYSLIQDVGNAPK
ncbi:MAG: DUF4159 domain-containing protein [Candidatus Latescibacteria bacterium]|nr:DUF4159 domain-containing protein [Candidatus Latescibacterota bacterium]